MKYQEWLNIFGVESHQKDLGVKYAFFGCFFIDFWYKSWSKKYRRGIEVFGDS
ncbi:hypothetical protein [Helicobacter pullorum]|uniref:hypothetical protein n=1 Tax=Helicobacter pullorum TaxID=35818 RepID=UPI001E48DEB7|nr:hypothetical protein [Helicobacter pullorum]